MEDSFTHESQPFSMSADNVNAHEHCRWAYRAGKTPQEVLKELGRPHHPGSTWQDAVRAVEAASIAMLLEAKRDADAKYLRSL